MIVHPFSGGQPMSHRNAPCGNKKNRTRSTGILRVNLSVEKWNFILRAQLRLEKIEAQEAKPKRLTKQQALDEAQKYLEEVFG